MSELLPSEFAAETQTAPCDGANFGTIAKKILTDANFAGLDDFETAKRVEGSAATGYYFLPQKTVEGTGTMKLLHMTYVFQIFVFMQIFNQLNARILTGSFNIFDGIFANWLFGAVLITTFVVQMTMVEVGGKITKTYPLEMWRNGICLIFGSGELLWGLFIKMLPTSWFLCFNFEEKPMTEEEQEKSTLASFKKGSSRRKKTSNSEPN